MTLSPPRLLHIAKALDDGLFEVQLATRTGRTVPERVLDDLLHLADTIVEHAEDAVAKLDALFDDGEGEL